jgi:hypothetical protein
LESLEADTVIALQVHAAGLRGLAWSHSVPQQESRMTDERNIAHDKAVADDKRQQGGQDAGESAIQPQPGKKPPMMDADTDPSNSRAREMYKQGESPRDHAHESRDNPPEDEQRDKPDAPRRDANER